MTVNVTNFVSNNNLGWNDVAKFNRLWLTSAKNLFHKNIYQHEGCVNAIEISNDELCLFSAVDTFNKRVVSGGNDQCIYIHHYATGDLIRSIDHFRAAILSISVDSESHTLAAATVKGKIELFDFRDHGSAFQVATASRSFPSVVHHPISTNYLATANAGSGVELWDTRYPGKPVKQLWEGDAMSVRWNDRGSQLVAIRKELPPILFDLSNPYDQLEFDAKGYYNSVTLKGCCFVGERQQYILSGSDDFNLYLWEVPEPWPENRWVPNEKMALKGHQSIVNQVIYCPKRQIIVSAGVESSMKVWSAYRMPGSRGDRDSNDNRERARSLTLDSALLSTTLQFFDGLLTQILQENALASLVHSPRKRWLQQKSLYLLNAMRVGRFNDGHSEYPAPPVLPQ